MPTALDYVSEVDRYVERHKKAVASSLFEAEVQPLIIIDSDTIPADIREDIIDAFELDEGRVGIELEFCVAFDADNSGASLPVLLTTNFGRGHAVDAFISAMMIDWLGTDEAHETLWDIAYDNRWISVRSMREEHGTW